ncbi:DUF1214 domain-containing protein [Nocardioides sp. YIM 152588]|uniref:DUF1214 domain-containing protein n=1 Tax=Nocardioides sp. YIM 152588 TaxID=3158259 RepID=UPI0032E3D8DC
MTDSPAPDSPAPASTAAWGELVAGLAELDTAFLSGDRAVPDEAGAVAGYRMLATLLGVAVDTYVFSDPARPQFLEAVAPHRRDRRWGGDNTDAHYLLAVVDPKRQYRVTGRPNDSVYFSLTVYNQPAPGAWSDRVVGVVNDADLDLDEDGGFELRMGPSRPADWSGPFIELTGDAFAALTRDYQGDPLAGRPVEWRIEALDEPGPVDRSDADLAAGLRSALGWLRTMFAIVPTPLAQRADDDAAGALGHQTAHAANEFAEPYRVPDLVFGWSATDACYAFGSFALADDEALVVTFTPPACRFWNLTVWNEFMAGSNAADGRTSVNLPTARVAEDGTVTAVIAHDLLDHPNAITTLGLARGNLALRFFLADEVPARPATRVVARAEVGPDVRADR